MARKTQRKSFWNTDKNQSKTSQAIYVIWSPWEQLAYSEHHSKKSVYVASTLKFEALLSHQTFSVYIEIHINN